MVAFNFLSTDSLQLSGAREQDRLKAEQSVRVEITCKAIFFFFFFLVSLHQSMHWPVSRFLPYPLARAHPHTYGNTHSITLLHAESSPIHLADGREAVTRRLSYCL